MTVFWDAALCSLEDTDFQRYVPTASLRRYHLVERGSKPRVYHTTWQGITFVLIFPGQSRFYGFHRYLSRRPNKFFSGRQMYRFFSKSLNTFMTKFNIFPPDITAGNVHGSSVTKIQRNFPLYRGLYTFPYLSAYTVILPMARCPCRILAKQSRYTPWWLWGESRYSSYSFLTSQIDRGEWTTSLPGRALPRGKDPR
jgi:hypothetical protein